MITKNPLNMSSFLLNYRAMHRSIEIMTPPPSSQINEEVCWKSALCCFVYMPCNPPPSLSLFHPFQRKHTETAFPVIFLTASHVLTQFLHFRKKKTLFSPRPSRHCTQQSRMDPFTFTTDPPWQEVRFPTWFHAHISTACNITVNLNCAQGNGSTLFSFFARWLAQTIGGPSTHDVQCVTFQKRNLGLARPTVSRTNSFHRHDWLSRKRHHHPTPLTTIATVTMEA